MTEHWWQHTKTAGAGPDPASGAALQAARQAREQSAREEAQRQLLALGQQLENSAVPSARANQSQLTVALDAETDTAESRAPVELCFFNPLHGISARHVRWRLLGQREALLVRACAECADRVHQRRQPDALTCQIHGHVVPYYEVDPRQSVWAGTGYGQFTDDLIERVLAGSPPG